MLMAKKSASDFIFHPTGLQLLVVIIGVFFNAYNFFMG